MPLGTEMRTNIAKWGDRQNKPGKPVPPEQNRWAAQDIILLNQSLLTLDDDVIGMIFNVNGALEGAAAAQSTATQAFNAASAADAKAVEAKTTAETIASTADSALATAQNAVTSANAAQNTAGEAVIAAENALGGLGEVGAILEAQVLAPIADHETRIGNLENAGPGGGVEIPEEIDVKQINATPDFALYIDGNKFLTADNGFLNIFDEAGGGRCGTISFYNPGGELRFGRNDKSYGLAVTQGTWGPDSMEGTIFGAWGGSDLIGIRAASALQFAVGEGGGGGSFVFGRRISDGYILASTYQFHGGPIQVYYNHDSNEDYGRFFVDPASGNFGWQRAGTAPGKNIELTVTTGALHLGAPTIRFGTPGGAAYLEYVSEHHAMRYSNRVTNSPIEVTEAGGVPQNVAQYFMNGKLVYKYMRGGETRYRVMDFTTNDTTITDTNVPPV